MPAERTTITGFLDGVEQSGNKTTYKVKKNENRQYPDWYIGYFSNDENEDSDDAPQLKSGKWYDFLCDVKEKGEKTYYNLVSASPTRAGSTTGSTTGSTQAPSKPGSAQAPSKGQGNGRSEPQAQPDPDPKRISIERQTAVNAVTQLVAAGKVDPDSFEDWFRYLCKLMSDGQTVAPTDKEEELFEK